MFRFVSHALSHAFAAFLLVAVSADAAFAQQGPAASYNSWVGIAIVLGLVVIVYFLISGALRLSGSEHEDEGSGLIEDIDEEEERERRRRRRR